MKRKKNCTTKYKKRMKIKKKIKLQMPCACCCNPLQYKVLFDENRKKAAHEIQK